MDIIKRTPKFMEARDSLPEDLRPIYDQMVEEYRFQALVHYGREYVAYKVVAELIRFGWRPSGK